MANGDGRRCRCSRVPPAQPNARTVVLALMVVSVLVLLSGVAAAAVPSITRGRAVAIAHAINLLHSDLPTFTAQSDPETAQQKRLTAQATACAGAVPTSEALVNENSPEFESGTEDSVTIGSSVEILPSSSLVARDLAAIERQRALRCLLNEFTSQLESSLPKGDAVAGAAGGRFRSVIPGVNTSFAIRLAFVVAVKVHSTKVAVPIYVDQIGFTIGQAEISLVVESTGTKPSTPLEAQLGSLLLRRARVALR
jgi:hypothetical protein